MTLSTTDWQCESVEIVAAIVAAIDGQPTRLELRLLEIPTWSYARSVDRWIDRTPLRFVRCTDARSGRTLFWKLTMIYRRDRNVHGERRDRQCSWPNFVCIDRIRMSPTANAQAVIRNSLAYAPAICLRALQSVLLRRERQRVLAITAAWDSIRHSVLPPLAGATAHRGVSGCELRGD